MKTVALITIALLFSFGLQGQSIFKSSIDNGGDATSAGNLSITYTLGEVNLQELSAGTSRISEGFISLETIVTSIGLNEGFEVLELGLYPNPTSGHIQIEGIEEAVQVVVYDTQARLVFEMANYTAGQSIQLHQLPAGPYVVKVIKPGGLGIFKLTKL